MLSTLYNENRSASLGPLRFSRHYPARAFLTAKIAKEHKVTFCKNYWQISVFILCCISNYPNIEIHIFCSSVMLTLKFHPYRHILRKRHLMDSYLLTNQKIRLQDIWLHPVYLQCSCILIITPLVHCLSPF